MVETLGLKALKINAPEDRLSALPDEILCHILSFLRTETAAATSILSTRWKDLFLTSPNIHLTVSKSWKTKTEEVCNREFYNFLNFCFRLIQKRNMAPIRKFKLHASPFIEDLRAGIYWLISAVLLNKVQELDICVEGEKSDRLYPPDIFTCTTLVTLTMIRDVDLLVPNSVSLPNLKVLHLYRLESIDEDSFSRLIQGCPSLEKLYLEWQNSKKVNSSLRVSAPLLKELALDCGEGKYSVMVESNNLEHFDCHVYGELKFVIDAPHLKYFYYYGHPVEVKFVQDVQKIVKANIVLDTPTGETESSSLVNGQRAFELINGLHCVEILDIESYSLEAFRYAGQSLPTLENLTSLSIDRLIYRKYVNPWWKMTSSLLESAPNLETLSIVSWTYDDKFSKRKLGHILRKAFPACSIQHLKEVNLMTSCDATEYTFKLVEYFLKNGKSLKKLDLCGSMRHLKSSLEYYNRILSVKKSSQDCQIVF